MIKDRLVSGALAGSVGAVIQNTYAFIAKSLGFQGPVYIDYGEYLLFYKDQSGPLTSFFGFIGHFVWDIIIGIIFAYLILNTSSRYYLLKGILYGVIVWFLIKAGSTLFKIPEVITVLPHTVAFFFFGSILFGISLAYTLKLLDNAKIII